MKVKLALHPDAAKNFDEKAGGLLLELTPEPERRSQENDLQQTTRSSFSPDRFISGHFSERDIIGELRMGWVDYSGKETARYFKHGGQFIGLYGEGYKKLARIAEEMHKSKQVYNSVSVASLIELMFDWVRDKYRNETALTMTEYVLLECEKRVQELEIWIPIAATHLQSELRIGKVVVKTITKEMLDRWRGESIINTPQEGAKINQLFDREQKKLQGLGAATIQLTAEPRRAFEIALEETETAIGLLRVFGPANFSPGMSSYCAVLGREHIETVTHLILQDGSLRYLNHGTVDKGFQPFILDDKLLSMVRGSGLDILSDLLVRERKNQFQEYVLNALLLYSRSCLEKNIPAKLIYVFAALESILLRNENEPVQQNIAERMAFTIGKTATERKTIIRNIKGAYALRSSFLHHGHGIDDVETVSAFMPNAWLFFNRLIQCANHFSTKEDFINAVEERKLS